MSIIEIKAYLSDPRQSELLDIIDIKQKEIEQKMKQLHVLKRYLNEKQSNMNLIHTLKQDQIIVKDAEVTYLYCTRIHHNIADIKNTDFMMEHLRNAWNYHPFKIGCGSYISMNKIRSHEFQAYDGLFSIIDKQPLQPNMRICEKGTYLYAYHIGPWNELSSLYEKILTYAKKNHYELSGNAYERGISELSVLSSEEYVTEIKIKCESIEK